MYNIKRPSLYTVLLEAALFCIWTGAMWRGVVTAAEQLFKLNPRHLHLSLHMNERVMMLFKAKCVHYWNAFMGWVNMYVLLCMCIKVGDLSLPQMLPLSYMCPTLSWWNWRLRFQHRNWRCVCLFLFLFLYTTVQKFCQ